MPKHRFVVDEGALTLDDVPEAEREDNLTSLIDQLDGLRVSQENVQLVGYWAYVECVGGENVAQSLATCKILDRDQSMLLLTLLDRCFAWDRPDDEDFCPGVVVNGNQIRWGRNSLGTCPGYFEELDCSRYDTPSLCGRCPSGRITV